MIQKSLKPKVYSIKIKDKKKIINFLKNEWKGSTVNFEKLFDYSKLINNFETNVPIFGICLKTPSDEIVGYQGFICHKSHIHKKWILNMTTWTVNKNFRNYSLMLLYYILKKSRNMILTNFSANEKVQRILYGLGFKEIDSSEKTFKTIPYAYQKVLTDLSFNSGKKAIEDFHKTFHQKIFEDHLKMGCSIISIMINNDIKIGIIFLKTGLKNNQAQVLYTTHEKMIRKRKIWIKVSLIALFHLKCFSTLI